MLLEAYSSAFVSWTLGFALSVRHLYSFSPSARTITYVHILNEVLEWGRCFEIGLRETGFTVCTL